MLLVAFGCAIFTGIRGGLFTVSWSCGCLTDLCAGHRCGVARRPLARWHDSVSFAPPPLLLQVAMTRLNVRIREKLFHSLMQQEAG